MEGRGIQRLCKEILKWAGEISEHHNSSMTQAKEFWKTIRDISIHLFSDASEIGFGQASFLRLISSDGDSDLLHPGKS